MKRQATRMEARNPGSIGAAMVWMFLISVLGFWLLVVGPLIAGFAGGRKAGGLGRAIVAVLILAIVVEVVLFVVLFAVTESLSEPLFVAIVWGTVLALAYSGPLFVGAILGGATKT